MKEELTDRERELLKWISFLIDMINRYSVFFGLINRDVDWLNGIWEKDNLKGKQDELIDYLKDEYDISLIKLTNKEYIKEGNNESSSV